MTICRVIFGTKLFSLKHCVDIIEVPSLCTNLLSSRVPGVARLLCDVIDFGVVALFLSLGGLLNPGCLVLVALSCHQRAYSRGQVRACLSVCVLAGGPAPTVIKPTSRHYSSCLNNSRMSKSKILKQLLYLSMLSSMRKLS